MSDIQAQLFSRFRKKIPVLCSDIRGFTSFSEKHEPEEVVSLLNEYLGAMTAVVFEHEGRSTNSSATRSWRSGEHPWVSRTMRSGLVRCALAMIGKLKELQAKWTAEGKYDIGIGINSGDMVVGNMGVEGKKMDYTVIGDNVNLAARLESLTRKYNNHIIISEYTYAKVKDVVQANELDSVAVKGKEKPVVVYDLVGLK